MASSVFFLFICRCIHLFFFLKKTTIFFSSFRCSLTSFHLFISVFHTASDARLRGDGFFPLFFSFFFPFPPLFLWFYYELKHLHKPPCCHLVMQQANLQATIL